MRWNAKVGLRLGAFSLDVDLHGTAERPVALIGPNGSGKTTLLRTIAGAYRGVTGRIAVGTRVLLDSSGAVDLPPEARRVGYVPQGYGLFPHLTALENVAFGVADPGGARGGARRAAHEALESIGCGDLGHRRPRTLSGGEAQRVALARALMIEPDILLLDEPLAALDPRSRKGLRSYLAAHLNQHDGPALVATHDARDVRALDAEVWVLENGRVVQSGGQEEVAAQPGSEFVEEFFG